MTAIGTSITLVVEYDRSISNTSIARYVGFMKNVGEKLQEWATIQKVFHEKDTFGRSAFNRYYYAAYLITREHLGKLDPKWKKEKHKAIQNTLVTTVRKPVIKELEKLLKSGVIKQSHLGKARDSLNIATKSLSILLKDAYDLRCIADYEPEIPIKSEKRAILLRDYKLSTACKWPMRASAYCKTISKIWKDSGLVR